jgi:CRP-like cAMP-binding protein
MSFDQRLRALHNCAFFSTVPETNLTALAQAMREERFEKGEVICEAGDSGDQVYVVMSGALEVRVPSDEGPARRLAPGDLFGEYGMFDGGLRTATVTCIEPSRLLTLDYARFRAFLLDFPETMFSIFGATVDRLLALERRAAGG